MRVRRRRWHPVWTRAPVVLLRYPGVLAAVVGAALVLGLVTAATPLFVSSAEGAAVRHEIAVTSPWTAGLTVTLYDRLEPQRGAPDPPRTLKRRDRFLRERLAGVPLVGEGVLTAVASPVDATAGGPRLQVLPVSRRGFLDQVRVLEEGPDDGVWLADSAAEALAVAPGDRLTLRTGSARATVAVAGLYRDLNAAAPREFWQPLQEEILRSAEPGGPALLLSEDPAMAGLAEELDLVLQFRWEFPVERGAVSASTARQAATTLQSVAASLEDALEEPVRSLFERATARTELPAIVDRAGLAVDSMRRPAGAVSVAAGLVALGVVGAAGVFGVRRRRLETTLLSVRGAGALGLGARAALEAVVPVAAGAAAGWFLARAAVDAAGPGAAPEEAAVRSALVPVVGWEAAAVALLGVVAGVTAARGGEEPSEPGRVQRALARAPWEVVALLLAAAAYVQLTVRGADEPGRVDALVLLFPMLFVAGLAGLASRVLERGLPRLRRVVPGRPAAYLAARRVAASGRSTLLLVTAVAAAAGTLVFAAALGTSLGRAADDKALIRNGSEVRAVIRGDRPLPGSPVPGSTVVMRVPSGTVLPTRDRVGVLGVDPRTFTAGAAWTRGLSSEGPDGLLAGLSGDEDRVAVLAVGFSLPARPSLELVGERLGVRQAASVAAFPGIRGEIPTVVMEAVALSRFLDEAGTTLGGVGGHREVWARAGTRELVAELQRAGVPPIEVTTAEAVRGSLPFLVVGWSVGLLEASGAVGCAVAVLALLVHLQARRTRQVAFLVLAMRMGLRRAAMVRSVALEVGLVLGLGLALGAALGLVAGLLVVSQVDPLPGFPPVPTLVVPLPALVAAGAFAVASAVVAALAARRWARRSRPSEVLRLAA